MAKSLEGRVSMTLAAVGSLKVAYQGSKAQQVVFVEGEPGELLASGDVYAQDNRRQRDDQANEVHDQQLPATVSRGDHSKGSREGLVGGGAHRSNS